MRPARCAATPPPCRELRAERRWCWWCRQSQTQLQMGMICQAPQFWHNRTCHLHWLRCLTDANRDHRQDNRKERSNATACRPLDAFEWYPFVVTLLVQPCWVRYPLDSVQLQCNPLCRLQPPRRADYRRFYPSRAAIVPCFDRIDHANFTTKNDNFNLFFFL